MAVRITIALKAAAIADFTLAAEKTGTLTLNWTKVAASVWTYDADAYYIVGVLGGEDKWSVSTDNQNISLDDEATGANIAQKAGVHFAAGDVIKVVKNYEVSDSRVWYGGKTDNTEGGKVSVSEDNGNITINTAGTYNVFVNDGNRVWLTYVGD